MNPGFGGKMNRVGKTCRRGTSLTEIMIAFFILCMAVLPVSGIISYGHKGTQKDMRNVYALQLLNDRMNQVSSLAYPDLDSLITSGNSAAISDTILSGTDKQVKLGVEHAHKTDYTVTLDLSRVPISFDYCPIDIVNSTNYLASEALTWVFAAKKTENYDGTLPNWPYKVLKVYVKVDWNEQNNTVARKVDALTYVVDLEK
jgi:hypothetical protein